MNTIELRQNILDLVEVYANQVFADRDFMPGITPIPPSGKVIGARELQCLVDASLDGWLTSGRFNDAFERRLAAFLGVRHVLTTNSGSSANLLALSALTSPRLEERAIRPGDEVITVAAGFPTTVNPILLHGAVPVFVDVHISTYNIDPEQIEAAVSEKTKAIMLAHTLGNPFELGEVLRVARKYNLWLIEDCCDALGSTYDSKLVGTFGDIGTLSFYPAHHITMGEGGAVVTNNGYLKPILESIRDWGRDCFCDPGKDNTCGKRFTWQWGDLPFGYDHMRSQVLRGTRRSPRFRGPSACKPPASDIQSGRPVPGPEPAGDCLARTPARAPVWPRLRRTSRCGKNSWCSRWASRY